MCTLREGLKATYAEDGKFAERGVLFLDSLDVVGDLASDLGWWILAEEVTQLLLLLIGVGGEPSILCQLPTQVLDGKYPATLTPQ